MSGAGAPQCNPLGVAALSPVGPLAILDAARPSRPRGDSRASIRGEAGHPLMKAVEATQRSKPHRGLVESFLTLGIFKNAKILSGADGDLTRRGSWES